MKNELIKYLGLAKRAGKLALGFDAAAESLQKGEAALILVSSDLSPKTGKEIKMKADEKNIGISVIPFTMDEIDYVLGKRLGIISLCDAGFAGTIEKIMNCPKDDNAGGTKI